MTNERSFRGVPRLPRPALESTGQDTAEQWISARDIIRSLREAQKAAGIPAARFSLNGPVAYACNKLKANPPLDSSFSWKKRRKGSGRAFLYPASWEYRIGLLCLKSLKMIGDSQRARWIECYGNLFPGVLPEEGPGSDQTAVSGESEPEQANLKFRSISTFSGIMEMTARVARIKTIRRDRRYDRGSGVNEKQCTDILKPILEAFRADPLNAQSWNTRSNNFFYSPSLLAQAFDYVLNNLREQGVLSQTEANAWKRAMEKRMSNS